jgi:hypothetical protein
MPPSWVKSHGSSSFLDILYYMLDYMPTDDCIALARIVPTQDQHCICGIATVFSFLFRPRFGLILSCLVCLNYFRHEILARVDRF